MEEDVQHPESELEGALSKELPPTLCDEVFGSLTPLIQEFDVEFSIIVEGFRSMSRASGRIFLIGKSEDCRVVVNHDSISDVHARVTVSENQVLVEDLGSAKGTLVGGKRISGQTILWPGQVFQVGSAHVQVRRSAELASSKLGHALVFLPEEKRHTRRYDVASLIARGGMGAVLDARDGAMERKVAMKVMLDPDDSDALARFVAEARITGQLEHPNIVPIHDIGLDENGHAYYTMKFVRGVTLADVLHGLTTRDAGTVQKYPLPVLMTMFQKVCDALAFAHSRGVIHRDLKPANIMLGDYGEVLVMDWGLAKLVDSAPAAGPIAPIHSSIIQPGLPEGTHSFGSTLSGTIMGTPQYMAPEQARGEIETLDARTDLYSLGAILFEILHLRPPFSDGTAMEIVHHVTRGEVEWSAPKKSTSATRQDIPASLIAVCRKALALDPAARYPHVAALQADLTAWQNGFATRAENAGAWTQIKLLIRRNRAATIGTAAVLAVGALLGTLAVIKGNEAATALGFLKKATPTFTAQAENLVGERKLAEAIEKLDFALAIEPENPDLHRRRAHLLQASVRLPEAAEAYRKVLSLRKDDPAATANLTLCLKIAGDPPRSSEPDALALRELYDSLRSQGRTVDSVTLGQRLGLGSKATEDAINLALKDWMALPEWQKEQTRVSQERDGTYRLNLSRMPIQNLAPLARLEGLPVSSINISDTLVSDFGPLQKLPLVSLTANGCPVTDLGPLANSQIRSLTIMTTKVQSIEPLRSMSSLVSLNIGYSKIPDLTPLRGLKITNLAMPYSGVSNLAGLETLPLKFLECSSNGIRDIAPLEGAPLESLSLYETLVSDLSPLNRSKLKQLLCYKCPNLKTLKGIEGLPLVGVNFHACRNLVDISALKGMKIRTLELRWLDSLRDFSPIGECLEISDLTVSGYHPLYKQFRGANIANFQWGEGETIEPSKYWADWDAFQLKQSTGTAEAGHAKELLTKAGWNEPEVKVQDDGTLSIAAGKSKLITDLSPLKGLNVSKLKLPDQPLSDLSPLAGMPITVLDISRTRVADLAPLREMPLRELYCEGSQVADLSPLRGAPVQILFCQATPLLDLSPLVDLPNLRSLLIPFAAPNVDVLRPLTKLSHLGWANDRHPESKDGPSTLAPDAFWKRYDRLSAVRTAFSKAGITLKETQLVAKPGAGVVFYVEDAPLTDFALLQPLPIDWLKLQGSKVADLSTLKGSKIRMLSLEKSLVTDLSPLLEMPALESVTLPAKPANLEVLRKHPTLRFLGYEADWDSKQQRVKLTTAEFWQRHDAAK